MKQNDILFELCIAYTKDNEDMPQAQYIRDKLGECTTSMQVEFSKFLMAARPEWQEKAGQFRETGKVPPIGKGSYKEAVFRKAVIIWDFQNETDEDNEERQQKGVERKARATKRKSTSRPKITRVSRSSKCNTTSTNDIDDHPPSAPRDKKRRKTRLKRKTADESDGSSLKSMEDSLALLTGGLHQIELHHNSMISALAEAHEANKELEREKSDLEEELEQLAESLEDESASLDQLRAENKKLLGESERRANETATLARMRAANKRLKQENSALNMALETAKEGHSQELSKQKERLDHQCEVNYKLQQQIVTLRSELEQLDKLHRRATESFSIQAKLLQEQCKMIVVSPEESFRDLKHLAVDDDTCSKLSDKTSRKARRISL